MASPKVRFCDGTNDGRQRQRSVARKSGWSGCRAPARHVGKLIRPGDAEAGARRLDARDGVAQIVVLRQGGADQVLQLVRL